jgi:DNA-binding transcriptional ArsR family regulator
MALVWETNVPAGEKLVLLALADCADDDGVCWPSVGTLARKTGQSQRTVQGALKALERAGHLTRDQRIGRGCYYTIHPRKICTPAKSAPPQNPANTPADSAPKPSGTTNDTIPNGIASTRARKPQAAKPAQKPRAKPAGTIARPPNVDAQVWADFLTHRKAKGAPVTETVIKQFTKEAEDVGWSLEDAMRESVLRGWQGFKAKWIRRDDNNNRKSSGQAGQPRSRDGFLNACHDAAMGGDAAGPPFGREDDGTGSDRRSTVVRLAPGRTR